MKDLLNEEARLGNELIVVRNKIREMRRDWPGPPVCFGTDDCSSMMLMSCPWRFDCGKDYYGV